MAEARKTPMPSSHPSQSPTVYSSAYPVNRKRESAAAPVPTGVRKQYQCGKDYQVNEQSAKKVD